MHGFAASDNLRFQVKMHEAEGMVEGSKGKGEE